MKTHLKKTEKWNEIYPVFASFYESVGNDSIFVLSDTDIFCRQVYQRTVSVYLSEAVPFSFFGACSSHQASSGTDVFTAKHIHGSGACIQKYRVCAASDGSWIFSDLHYPILIGGSRYLGGGSYCYRDSPIILFFTI